MPHSRKDQRNLFRSPTPAVDQRERASTKRENQRAERDEGKERRTGDDAGVAAYIAAVKDTQRGELDHETPRHFFSREERPVINKDFFLGRTRFTPLELAMQKDRDFSQRPERGIPGEIFEEGRAIIRGGLELGSELADRITGRGPTTQRDILDKSSAQVLRFGKLDEEVAEEIKKTSGTSTDSQISQIRTATTALEAKKADAERVLGDLDPDKFDDPTLAHAAEQLREEKEVELAEIEVELLNLQNQLGVQDLIFDIETENAGLGDALDLAPLEEALGQDGGLGASTYDAILELATNAALSVQERDEGIDLVLARQHFSKEIILTINDMVQNRDDLVTFLERSDVDLLDNPAEFLNPSKNFSLDGTNDSDRFLADLDNAMADFLEENVPITIPTTDVSYEDFDILVLDLMKFGINDQEVVKEINRLASVWGIDETEMFHAMKGARELAVNNKQQWDDVLDADSAIPGSKGMQAAIYQAGELIGFDPDQLLMASMSKALHALIDTKSQGVSGQKGEGTIAGMGGLTLDMYEQIMGLDNGWTPQQGMSYELQALLGYIREKFGGDALAAVNFWRSSGEWGGTEAFPRG